MQDKEALKMIYLPHCSAHLSIHLGDTQCLRGNTHGHMQPLENLQMWALLPWR